MLYYCHKIDFKLKDYKHFFDHYVKINIPTNLHYLEKHQGLRVEIRLKQSLDTYMHYRF